MATGIRKRGESWEASVYLKRERRKLRKTFGTFAAAKAWRADAASLATKGALRTPTPTTVQEAWTEWKAGADAGTVRNRSGDTFKPPALRSYERAMRLRVLPEFGGVRLADLTRLDVQELADRLLADGLNPSTVKCTLLPMRAVCNLAISRGELGVNPCDGLRLPAVRGGRDRIADPVEAARLIAGVPERDRALWATAMYSGLRVGELRALRAESIDAAAGVIHIERAWDEKEGEIAPKSAAGRRRVPIAAVLRDHLLEHVMAAARSDHALAFGRTPTTPFYPKAVQERADTAWKAAGLQRITFHECRHSFASLMIASGVNIKALQTFMGHANISTTLDRYGHLLPGSEAEAAGLLDGYLSSQRKQAEDQARTAGTGAFTGASIASLS